MSHRVHTAAVRVAQALLPLSILHAAAGAQVVAETDKLTGSGAQTFDFFGESADIDGDTVVIGATELSFPDFGAGSVYVFRKSAGAWLESARIGATDGGPGQAFGRSVAIDGDTLLVGSDQDAPIGDTPVTGSVVVYGRTASGWERRARLLAADGAAGDLFGWSVDLAGDRAIVGAWRDDGARGAAYVFVRQASGWTQEAKLVAPDGTAEDELGFAVAIDGERALVGARGDDDAGDQSGSAYVFVRRAGGWSREARLLPPVAGTGAGPGARFGTAVSLDGARALVGAPGGHVGGQALGSAHVFVRAGSTWTEELALVAPSSSTGFAFGRAVQLDGDRAVVGQPSGSAGGAAHVFERVPAGWVRTVALEPSDNRDGQLFGQVAALDGTRVLVAAPFGVGLEDTSGAAYVFDAASPAGTPYCLGDGTGAPCPCANESTPGQGDGCRNSTLGAGRLVTRGSASVASDDLELLALGLPPGTPALLVSGTVAAGGAPPFGDGQLCVGGALRRLGAARVGAAGSAVFAPDLGVGPGDVRVLQVHYRDTTGGPCGAGFNATNGTRVVFTP